jgi:hypothetical protein
MLDDLAGALVTDPNQPSAAPYRPFRDWPSALYIEAVAKRIKETGEPEKIAGLYHRKIDRTAKFRILRKVYIDQKKRPNGDMAPCPRCGCADKFLRGVLAWFPDLQFCAVIGHCCADNEALNEAERDFKRREKQKYEEDYLLEGLPLLARKADLLVQWRGPASEALRIYREFRKGAPAIHQHLRALKERRGGELRLVEILRSAEDDASDYVGPAGFTGRGRNETVSRDIDFGFVAGLTAASRHFNPVKDLETTVRVLDSFDARPDEEEALHLICDMTEAQRRAAVAILQELDKAHAKLAEKMNDFWRFFERANIQRLDQYGTHSANHFPFEAGYRSEHGRTLVVLTHRRVECRLSFADKFSTFAADWPAARSLQKLA